MDRLISLAKAMIAGAVIIAAWRVQWLAGVALTCGYAGIMQGKLDHWRGAWERLRSENVRITIRQVQGHVRAAMASAPGLATAVDQAAAQRAATPPRPGVVGQTPPEGA